MVIIYSHAYDMYNCVFRMIALLYRSRLRFSIEQLRIFDFMVAFPEMIHSIELPRGVKRGRRIFENKYMSPQNHRAAFYTVENFQISALNYLASASIIDRYEYARGVVVMSEGVEISKDLALEIDKMDEDASRVLAICIEHLYNVPVDGVRGLKQRSSMMEHRYDG